MTGRWFIIEQPQGQFASAQRKVQQRELLLKSDGTALGHPVDEEQCIGFGASPASGPKHDYYWRVDENNRIFKSWPGHEEFLQERKAFSIEFSCYPPNAYIYKPLYILVCFDGRASEPYDCSVYRPNSSRLAERTRVSLSRQGKGSKEPEISDDAGISGSVFRRGTSVYSLCADGNFLEQSQAGNKPSNSAQAVSERDQWLYVGSWELDGGKLRLHRRGRKKADQKAVTMIDEILSWQVKEELSQGKIQRLSGNAVNCSLSE